MRFGKFWQAERLLQLFLNLLRVRLEHAEALIVGLLGVVAGEIDERALVSALRNENMNSRGAGALARVCSESKSSSSSRSSKSTGT